MELCGGGVWSLRNLEVGPRIVAIGGGTGLSTLLRGLKEYTSNITAIVTVADDGGSSGRLRREMGVLPPGDIRNCLVALADAESLMQQLFQYRFGDDGPPGLAGHNFGNLFIATMSEVTGDFELAIKESSRVLAVRGQVLPSTLSQVVLVAELEDGSSVKGESMISKCFRRIRRIRLEPEDVEPLPEALDAIRAADMIVLGPGSLYTSVLPNIMVKGIRDAIKEVAALKVYVSNVMTQPGETDHFTARDHVSAICEHIGPGVLDYAVVNVGIIPLHLLEKYRLEGAEPVLPDVDAISSMGIRVIEGDFVCQNHVVRHDPLKLAEVIVGLTKRADDYRLAQNL